MKTSPKEIELRHLAELLGSPQHPVTFVPIIWGKKSPYTKGWNLVTPEESQTAEYQKILITYGNTGLLLGAASGGLIAIDCDNDEEVKSWILANPWLDQTTQRVGNRGRVFLIRILNGCPANLNLSGRGEIKSTGTQVVVRGKHPKGRMYSLNGLPPISIPLEELHFPKGWDGTILEAKPVSESPGGQHPQHNSSDLCIMNAEGCPSNAEYYISDKARAAGLISVAQEFASEFGQMGVDLYQKWVFPFEENLQPGERNGILTHSLVPILFDKCGIKMILQLVAQFYERNKSVFRDSFSAHMKQAKHVLAALLHRYPMELTESEAHEYIQINDPDFCDLFRILRSLAFYDNGKDSRPPNFFISYRQLAARLGLKAGSDTAAQKMMRTMISYRIVRLEKRGTQLKKGQRAIANEYRYLLDEATPEEVSNQVGPIPPIPAAPTPKRRASEKACQGSVGQSH